MHLSPEASTSLLLHWHHLLTTLCQACSLALAHGCSRWSCNVAAMDALQTIPYLLADDRVAKMCPHFRDPQDPTAWAQCQSRSLVWCTFSQGLFLSPSAVTLIRWAALATWGLQLYIVFQQTFLIKPGTKSISSNHFLKNQFFHYSFRRIMTNIFVSIPLPELLLGINSILYHRIPNMLTMPDIVCTEQISAALLTKWVRERNPLEMICLEAYAIDLKKNGEKN